MEPVGSESLLLGLKQFLIDITEPATKSQVWALSVKREYVEWHAL